MFKVHIANVCEYKFLRFWANPQKYQTLLPAKNNHLKVLLYIFVCDLAWQQPISNARAQSPHVSLLPRPLPTREKGLVHTDCACAHLYPESRYIIYSHKILSKLSTYDYVIFSNLLVFSQQAHEANAKTLFERLTSKQHQRRLPRYLFELKVKM